MTRRIAGQLSCSTLTMVWCVLLLSIAAIFTPLPCQGRLMTQGHQATLDSSSSSGSLVSSFSAATAAAATAAAKLAGHRQHKLLGTASVSKVVGTAKASSKCEFHFRMLEGAEPEELCTFKAKESTAEPHNGESSRPHPPKLRLGPRGPGWIACGRHVDAVSQTGWSELHIATSATTDYPEPTYAAGFVEGHLTHSRIYEFFQNTQASRSEALTNELTRFVKVQRAFLESSVAKVQHRTHRPTGSRGQSRVGEPERNDDNDNNDNDVRYWTTIKDLLRQVEGLHDGYNEATVVKSEALSLDQFWLMNMDGDLIELQGAVAKGFVNVPGGKPPPDDLRQHDPDAGLDRFQEVSEQAQWKSALQHTVGKGFGHTRGRGGTAHHTAAGASFVEEEASEMGARQDANDALLAKAFAPSFDPTRNDGYQPAAHDLGGERQEWNELVRRVGHCTALVALVKGGDEDVLVGHNSWEDYNEMLRSFKHYEFAHPSPSRAHDGGTAQPFRMSMSSYPGLLASTDDYYQLGSGLVVVETTLVILEPKILRKIQTRAVPSWIASLTANRLARDAEEWTQIFRRYNAGTYNCQWMVLDYNKLKKGRRSAENAGGSGLPAGTFWVLETVPGLAVARDLTSELQHRGFWLSANRPFFPEIRSATGYDSRSSDLVTFDRNPRARLARRLVPNNVHALEELMWFMRYNSFQKDAESLGDPAYSIASRADLEVPKASLNGAVDAKCVNVELMEAGRTLAISGPTAQGQKPFSFDDWPAAQIQHHGMPTTFNFDWFAMTGFSKKSLITPTTSGSQGGGTGATDNEDGWLLPHMMARTTRSCKEAL